LDGAGYDWLKSDHEFAFLISEEFLGVAGAPNMSPHARFGILDWLPLDA
jgi:hypothetical protein